MRAYPTRTSYALLIPVLVRCTCTASRSIRDYDLWYRYSHEVLWFKLSRKFDVIMLRRSCTFLRTHKKKAEEAWNTLQERAACTKWVRILPRDICLLKCSRSVRTTALRCFVESRFDKYLHMYSGTYENDEQEPL